MPFSHRSPRLFLAAVLSLSACSDGDPDDPIEPWRASSTVELLSYRTCDELEQDIKARALEELDALVQQMEDYGGFPPAAGGDDGGGEPDREGDGDGEVSGTNNQEEGVDEADLVKTDRDGRHLY